MKVSASVASGNGAHTVRVATNESSQALTVPAKPAGDGSAVNGGEFLVLALATCYCNDLYREAKRLGLTLTSVEVEASAEFAGVGLAAHNIQYRARVDSPDAPEKISQLLRETDAVAAVHNTVRTGTPVTLLDAPREESMHSEMLRQVYAALNRGDIAGAVKDFDEEIVWIQFGETYRGIADVTALFAQGRGTWAEGSCEPEQIIDCGDKFVVNLYIHVRVKGETAFREGRHSAVYTFRNGKPIEMRIIDDAQQALAWARGA